MSEAQKLNIPVVAILDTNCDPDVVDYPIPGNDDAIRSTGLLSRLISTAVAEGKKARSERELAAAKEAAGDAEKVEVAAKVEAAAEVVDAAADAEASAEADAATDTAAE